MANKVFVEFEIDDSGALKKITGFNKKIDGFGKKTEKAFKNSNRALESFIGNLGALAVSRGISLINQQISEAIDNAIAFDKALIGVEKTTGLTGKGLQDLAKRTIELSKAIPKSAAGLLALQQIAGQLGVRGAKNLLAFSETMVRLEASTDLAGESGAQNILKILNITDEGVDVIDRFGSAVSFLGNNFNVMESQIVTSGSAIASATSRFNLSSADVLGLATATVELGLQARVSGSTIGLAFREIKNSIRDAGASFETLQKITGLTGEQLKQTFEKDAVSVFNKFISGISKIDNISGVLQQFNLAGSEVERVLPSLAKKSENLSRAISDSNIAFTENVALLRESAAAFKSLEAQEEIVDNRLDAITRGSGARFAKFIIDLKTNIAEFGEALQKSFGIISDLFDGDPAEELSEVNFHLRENEKVLAIQLKRLQQLKDEGGPTGFARLFITNQEDVQKSIEKTIKRIADLEKQQKSLREETFVGPRQAVSTDEEDKLKEKRDKDIASEEEFLNAKQQLIVNKRKELQIAIDELEETIQNERFIAEEERTLANLEVDDEKSVESLVKLQELQDKRLEIQKNAALKRTELIVDEAIRELEQDKIKQTFQLKQDKINNARKLKAQSAFQKQTQSLDRQNQALTLSLAQAGADAALAISGDNQLAGLAISKAFAVADVFVKDGLARATAQAAALQSASASGPAAPTVYAAALAGFNASISKSTALALGIIGTQTVASVARFQTGGLVSGIQTGDRNTVQVDGGEGILTREGVRAIADLNSGESPAQSGSNTTINVENFIGSEEFVDDLIVQLNDAQEFRGQELISRGVVD